MWKQFLWKEITVYQYLQRLEPSLVQELKGHSFENLLVFGASIDIINIRASSCACQFCVCVGTLEN